MEGLRLIFEFQYVSGSYVTLAKAQLKKNYFSTLAVLGRLDLENIDRKNKRDAYCLLRTEKLQFFFSINGFLKHRKSLN